MKKFLSALIAMTMIVSCVATVAFADVSGITGTLTKADLTESQQTTAGVGDGQVGYILKLNLSNFGTLSSDGDATGRKLQTLQLNLSVDNPENVVRVFGKSYKTPKPTGWKTKATAPLTKQESNPIYKIPSNGTDASTLYPQEETEVTSINSVYELYIVISGDVVITPAISGGVATFDEGDLVGDPENFTGVALPTLSLEGPAGSSTVDVTSVTISGATAATVGDNVSLTATVLPDNATDKTVTWTKVSGNGAVSDSGVVTATAAGDVVVKATAGGVDSANYTVTFAPATVDVTSVTISGATAATVGDNVSLTATVLPDNATDKTVTWTKVSGNGAVSDSGVVTATAAGDVVVKATAGGVDSANYTVSFAAAAPADIVPAAADKDTYSNASTGLKDAFGKNVTIDSSRSYGAAKFENVVLDDGEYVYKVFATGINKTSGLEETKSWDVVDGSVEITGANVSFIAIVRSATHTITSVVLKAFAKSE